MSRTKIKLYVTCLLVLLFTDQCVSLVQTRTVVDQMRIKFLNIEKYLWDTVINEQPNDISPKTSKELIQNYRQFADELYGKMSNHISHGLLSLEQERLWLRVSSEMRPLYTLYETFRKLITIENGIPSPRDQWVDFANMVLSGSSSASYLKSTVPQSMDNLQQFVENDKLFKTILGKLVFEVCDLRQSPNQVLYNLYNAVSLTELKAYVMVQFAYMVLQIFQKENKEQDSKRMTETYKTMAKQAVNEVKEAMNVATREIWKCDPKVHVEDETYTQLTELLQGFLINEVDMNPRSNCLQSCDYYEYTKKMGCYRGICKKQRPCNGKIIQCKFVAADMNVCEASPNSGRRYDYIEYDNDRVFGRNTGCNRGTTRVESWWRWLFWHCSYCICLCDEETSSSDRYFSLRSITSDVNKNRVVTGIRFKKMNRIIHLQIQEAELMPFGNINSTSSRWKAVDDFRITDGDVHHGGDYHTLSWEKRDIDLDDLFAPDGYLLTGVKFRVIGTHLNLEIQATPFNFTTGRLLVPNTKSFWHSSDSTLARTKIQINNPDIPTRTQFSSRPDSRSDQYLEFTNTDLERDVGQTTVPFIDTQDVISDDLVPLSGAGIYHKGQPNFGGFIAPKIFTYDYSKHIKSGIKNTSH